MKPALLEFAILRETSLKKATALILSTSAVVMVLLLGVIYGHGRAASTPGWVSFLPVLNALLNTVSAVFLVRAYLAIRRRDVASHAQRILVSLGSSSLFLVSYVVYHSVHGDTKFTGVGPIRPLYFFVLITHVTLSAVALPMIFFSLFLSLSGRFPRHKAVSRYTLPIWLYVSVTGVLVFVLLRCFG